MQFPELSTRSLQGKEKLLPKDLPAQRTLLLLAFQQRHQRDVDEWMAVADEHGWVFDLTAQVSSGEQSLPHFATIEVPCISRRWGPVRRFIDGGMATGIGIPEVLARTWTAYTDVGRVQRALGITNSEQIWVGVIERGGAIVGSERGRPTGRSIDAVRLAMDAD